MPHQSAPSALETGFLVLSAQRGGIGCSRSCGNLRDRAFLFIGASHDMANPVPIGSHPAVDGLFSSQRITVIHDGARFSRFQKVRELASWPAALAALRVCPGQSAGIELNCGVCEKCLRTRLELLAAGIEETAALGPSLTPIELWNERSSGRLATARLRTRICCAPLRARGLDALCEVLEQKSRFSGRTGEDMTICSALRPFRQRCANA